MAIDIIMNEYEWITGIMNGSIKVTKPSKAAFILAKYYFSSGMNSSEVGRRVQKFLEDYDAKRDIVTMSDRVTSIVKRAKTMEMVKIDGIPITKSELDVVNSIKQDWHRRVLFAILVLAKYGDIRNENNNGWENYSYRDIFCVAGVRATDMRKAAIIKDLRDTGHISFGKRVDNIGLRANFIDANSEAEFIVKDINNASNEYLMYMNPVKYIRCRICGRVVRKSNNRQIYCLKCSI